MLLTDRNVRGVTRHVAESAARLLGSDLAHVTLVTENDRRLVVEAATGPLAASVGAAVPLESSMAGWVIAHAQPLVLNDPDSGGGNFRTLHEGIPLRRSVMLPLIDVAVSLIHFYCKQIFIDGLYHADPHPGNIIIVPPPAGGATEVAPTLNHRIAMVDFGATASSFSISLSHSSICSR